MIYYVDCAAQRGGCGTKERPFRWINDAAKVACPGDEVLVAPGIYREWVAPCNAGTEENPIVYRSQVPLGAVITGAEQVKSWTREQGDVWVARIPNGIFGDYNPFVQRIGGDWFFSLLPLHTGELFLNGHSLYEAENLEQVLKPEVDLNSWEEQELTLYKWYTCQENDETVIYANFRGKNPNEETVEITVRRNCFMPSRAA